MQKVMTLTDVVHYRDSEGTLCGLVIRPFWVNIDPRRVHEEPVTCKNCLKRDRINVVV